MKQGYYALHDDFQLIIVSIKQKFNNPYKLNVVVMKSSQNWKEQLLHIFQAFALKLLAMNKETLAYDNFSMSDFNMEPKFKSEKESMNHIIWLENLQIYHFS